MESRTGAFCCASLLASADTSRLASPSSDPTAMVSVVGRAYQRHANRLAPATSTTIPATRVKRSQAGNLLGSMRSHSINLAPISSRFSTIGRRATVTSAAERVPGNKMPRPAPKTLRRRTARVPDLHVFHAREHPDHIVGIDLAQAELHALQHDVGGAGSDQVDGL